VRELWGGGELPQFGTSFPSVRPEIPQSPVNYPDLLCPIPQALGLSRFQRYWNGCTGWAVERGVVLPFIIEEQTMDTSCGLNDSSKPVIDMDVIDGLRELGGEEDPGLVLELIEMFLDDAPKRIEEMTRGLECGDLDLMSRAAHTLKSASANMGAVLLSQICKVMEDAARKSDADSYRDMAPTVQSAYSDFEKALRGIS